MNDQFACPEDHDFAPSSGQHLSFDLKFETLSNESCSAGTESSYPSDEPAEAARKEPHSSIELSSDQHCDHLPTPQNNLELDAPLLISKLIEVGGWPASILIAFSLGIPPLLAAANTVVALVLACAISAFLIFSVLIMLVKAIRQ